jgi:two-component system phosphate regulon sensor histidine kinase PhoR
LPVAETPVNYNRRFARLLDVCRSMSTSNDLNMRLQQVVSAAAELLNTESASVLIYEKKTRSLRFIMAPWKQLEALKKISVPIHRSVAGWVYTRGQPMALNEAGRDERVFRVVDREVASNTRSLLAVPMFSQGNTIGVLEVVNRKEPHPFTVDDILILETLAAQSALVIEIARLTEESKEALRTSEQINQVKKDFMAVASHELRTPIGVIIGHSHLLEESVTAELKGTIQIIQKNAMRLKDIVEQFTSLDQLDEIARPAITERVTIGALVKDTVESIGDLAAEKQVAVVVESPAFDPLLEGDPEKMLAAMKAVVENAIVFNHPDGRVTIRISSVTGKVLITVIDTGIGIPMEEQGRIFERFYQVEKHLVRRHGGLGLGLSIARSVVEGQGGKIWVESIEGQGSTFYVLLPQATM